MRLSVVASGPLTPVLERTSCMGRLFRGELKMELAIVRAGVTGRVVFLLLLVQIAR
jgi:hypothetical protein